MGLAVVLGCYVFAACFCVWPVYGFFDLFSPGPALSAFSPVESVQVAQWTGLPGLLATALEALAGGWLETGQSC